MKSKATLLKKKTPQCACQTHLQNPQIKPEKPQSSKEKHEKTTNPDLQIAQKPLKSEERANR